MNKPRILIKLGGAALDAEKTLQATGEAILNFRRLGYSVVVVHGGGPAINAELTKRGIAWTFINGQRVTTPQMIDAIESTLCGEVNRRLVHHFSRQDIPAMGLSGTDHETLLCTKASVDLGQVGAIQKVNSAWIERLLALPLDPVPVIAPLGVGANGERYNINADWSASHLAVALQAEQLIFLTDQQGILDEEGEVISVVGAMGLQGMMEFKVVSGGMLTKTQAIIHALSQGVPVVRVAKAQDAALLAGTAQVGTLCQLTLGASPMPVREEQVYAAV